MVSEHKTEDPSATPELEPIPDALLPPPHYTVYSVNIAH